MAVSCSPLLRSVLDSPGRWPHGLRSYADADIKRADPGRRDGQRIDVELADVGAKREESRDTKQRVLQCALVGARGAAEAPKQAGAAKLADHLRGIDVAERMQPHGRIGEQIEEDASRPAHHEWSEGRVVRRTDEHLRAARHHALDEKAVEIATESA